VVDIFDEGRDSFEDMPYGHHKVTLTVLEKDGTQYIKETDKGPRVTFKLTNGDASVLTGQTFNGKRGVDKNGKPTAGTMGLISAINACFGFTKEQANELVTVAPTDTTFDMTSLHNLCAMWASSDGGWIEVRPGRDPKYPDVQFRRFKDGAPKRVKTATDYASAATSSGGSGADMI